MRGDRRVLAHAAAAAAVLVAAASAACGHGSRTPGPGARSTSTARPPGTTAPASSRGTCPASAQLAAAWEAAPAAVRQSSRISGFKDIRCWRSWVGALPAAGAAPSSSGGYVFFSVAGGLHVLVPAEQAGFKKAICASSSTAPLPWAGPVCNIQ